MKITDNLDFSYPPLCAALGFFDGIHLGHQKIITETVTRAKSQGLASAVVTFIGHPANILAGNTVVPLLTDNAEKARIIEGFGVDYLIFLPFEKTFSRLTPSDFVKNILKEKLNITEAFCGSNYSFGCDGSGHADDLLRLGKRYGIAVNVVSPIKKSDCVVSSSYVRSYLAAGKITTANALLGRPFSITSSVIHGKHLGTERLFPTINQYLPETSVVLKYGVYATRTVIDGKSYKSVTNVGVRPTVDTDAPENTETYILDFDGELYDKEIRVEYLTRLRDEIRFYNLDQLKEQISLDITARNNMPL